MQDASNAPKGPIGSNPYYRPISDLYRHLPGIEWEFPFVPQVVQSLVMCFILIVLAILFLTIGVASQTSTAFLKLIAEAREHVRGGSAVERSAWAVTAGVYFFVLLPFWAIQFPFAVLGRIWSRFPRALPLSLLMSACVLVLVSRTRPDLLERVRGGVREVIVNAMQLLPGSQLREPGLTPVGEDKQ
ncbi:MAG: hypothetical protein HN976_40685 [Lentisphaerae bacterium]|jgi:hypothetical protein|nr:hypothetical protein [Lentisphaerota bacterium]MBT7061474.1 hypothetical protein [Lentisphaerota bacterium]